MHIIFLFLRPKSTFLVKFSKTFKKSFIPRKTFLECEMDKHIKSIKYNKNFQNIQCMLHLIFLFATIYYAFRNILFFILWKLPHLLLYLCTINKMQYFLLKILGNIIHNTQEILINRFFFYALSEEKKM